MTGKDAQQAPTRNEQAEIVRASSQQGHRGSQVTENPFLLDPPSNDCSANSNPIALR